jgi:hypothetical protein
VLRRPRISVIVAMLAALAAAACARDRLENAYTLLYASKYAIEFPVSEEHMQRCSRDKAQTCYELVRQAREGKQILLAAPKERALETTLDTIVTSCPSAKREQICLGAVIALYFFREPEQDTRIRKRLLSSGNTVLHKVLGPSLFAWYGNRPQPELWIEALRKLPPDAFPREGKQTVLDAFAQPDRTITDDRVWLLR